jgi:hypothetical protein
MAQGKFKRKLATIPSADAAGCSRRMGVDEAAAARPLEASTPIISDLLKQPQPLSTAPSRSPI